MKWNIRRAESPDHINQIIYIALHIFVQKICKCYASGRMNDKVFVVNNCELVMKTKEKFSHLIIRWVLGRRQRILLYVEHKVRHIQLFDYDYYERFL